MTSCTTTLLAAIEALEQAKSPTPRIDAELLLIHALGISMIKLRSELDLTLSDQEQNYFPATVCRSPNFFPNRLTFFRDIKASIKQ